MKTTSENGILTVFLAGDIDAQNAKKVETEIAQAWSEHPDDTLTIDASDLTYISSAGLRVLMTFNKKSKDKLTILNVPKEVYEIFEMTRFTDLMDIKKKLREISVDGCQVIGKGRSSSVYRIAPEMIVKLYTDKVPLNKILQELDLAKKAFVAGVPTAIS